MQAHNHDDEAETAYRNKMSKLKKNPNRKSYDYAATAPISPQESFLRY